jgi:hypothetical protein
VNNYFLPLSYNNNSWRNAPFVRRTNGRAVTPSAQSHLADFAGFGTEPTVGGVGRDRPGSFGDVDGNPLRLVTSKQRDLSHSCDKVLK